jgi:hypothetical protein
VALTDAIVKLHYERAVQQRRAYVTAAEAKTEVAPAHFMRFDALSVAQAYAAEAGVVGGSGSSGGGSSDDGTVGNDVGLRLLGGAVYARGLVGQGALHFSSARGACCARGVAAAPHESASLVALIAADQLVQEPGTGIHFHNKYASIDY